MPTLDRVLILDAPSGVLWSRAGEFGPDPLERQRQRYLAFARRCERATVLDATRSPLAVATDVRELVRTT
ncbi:hypothetical protein [Pseudoclavibacter sp. JSM 162008]|uniref:hypothetical protein n=1 Tax=Pseudoclavibacter sp. JSM 162008 TaxID=3229855 RepID=UPI003525FB0E